MNTSSSEDFHITHPLFGFIPVKKVEVPMTTPSSYAISFDKYGKQFNQIWQFRDGLAGGFRIKHENGIIDASIGMPNLVNPTTTSRFMFKNKMNGRFIVKVNDRAGLDAKYVSPYLPAAVSHQHEFSTRITPSEKELVSGSTLFFGTKDFGCSIKGKYGMTLLSSYNNKHFGSLSLSAGSESISMGGSIATDYGVQNPSEFRLIETDLGLNINHQNKIGYGFKTQKRFTEFQEYVWIHGKRIGLNMPVKFGYSLSYNILQQRHRSEVRCSFVKPADFHWGSTKTEFKVSTDGDLGAQISLIDPKDNSKLLYCGGIISTTEPAKVSLGFTFGDASTS